MNEKSKINKLINKNLVHLPLSQFDIIVKTTTSKKGKSSVKQFYKPISKF